MKPIAIIPARGGSKRIPRKNIKLFNGNPVIAFAIEEALRSGIFEEILVSTDDAEIAEIAKSYDASVPFFRSAENSNDFATTADVLKEVLSSYKEKSFTHACCIYPVNPFITSDNLKRAYSFFRDHNYDSVFSAVKYDFPVQRSFMIENQRIRFIFPEYQNTRSQDLQPVYHDAGQFYFFKTEVLLRTGKLLTDNSSVIEIPSTEVQDIDTETDWELAEIKYQRLQQKK